MSAPPARYSDRPLPAYRHRPGTTPHPTRDPEGHSWREADADHLAAACHAAAWRTCAPYLFGCDLFNRRYFWEAHEAWEQVWRASDRASAEARFLRGLIQIGASLLKAELGQQDAAERLADKGTAALASVVRERGPRFMGLEIDTFLDAVASSRRGGELPYLLLG